MLGRVAARRGGRGRLLECLVGLLVLATAEAARAGSFTVSPLRVRLHAGEQTAVLTIRNEGDQTAVVQARAFAWRQRGDGADDYEPSNELVIFPKIVSIGKKEEKTVRIGFPGDFPDREHALRVYFEELPVSEAGVTAVRMALKIGIPVFVEPKVVVSEMRVDSVRLTQGSLAVHVRNAGNAHVLIKGIAVTGVDSSGSRTFDRRESGWYVLAGSARTFGSTVEPQDCARTRAVRLHVEFEIEHPSDTGLKGDGRFDIERADCTRPARLVPLRPSTRTVESSP